jgi:hypothetical protein
MTSPENKQLQRWIAPKLKVVGFRKTGATWRRTTEESVVLLNIQGSQWSRSFYINLGAYYRVLGDLDRPSEYQCHVRARLSQLVPDQRRLADLLDFERPMPDDERSTELIDVVVAVAIPWLESVATVSGGRACLQADPRRLHQSPVAVRDFLSDSGAPS